MSCFLNHDWGFPRRWKSFEGVRDVDVQRCLQCGQYRKSIVQFGPDKPTRAELSVAGEEPQTA